MEELLNRRIFDAGVLPPLAFEIKNADFEVAEGLIEVDRGFFHGAIELEIWEKVRI